MSWWQVAGFCWIAFLAGFMAHACWSVAMDARRSRKHRMWIAAMDARVRDEHRDRIPVEHSHSFQADGPPMIGLCPFCAENLGELAKRGAIGHIHWGRGLGCETKYKGN